MNNYRLFFLLHTFGSIYFRPILSLYFLTMEGVSVEQIGIYVAVMYITKSLLEVPSGYIGDTFGHRKTLIASQFFLLLACLVLVFATGIIHFVVAALFMALYFSLKSGTSEAFFYEMLEEQGDEEQFVERWGKFTGNLSFISVFFFLLYPIVAEGNMSFVFWLSVIFASIGLVCSLLLTSSSVEYKGDSLSIVEVAKK